ncbi:MAG: hypothetical protein IKM59_00690 [Oscillospiraceae bacterium]|nr:hypothetical protein [Oscillospiraceae bacterium]
MSKRDPFSQKHPLVCFLYFVAVILLGTVIRHPAYVIAGCIAAGSYYGCLKGKGLWTMLLGLLPLLILVSLLNPLFNSRGAHILFFLFGRPFTWESVCFGFVTAGTFAQTILWFGCYNVVLTGDKFTALFGNLIPALSLLLVMVLRMMGEQTRKLKQILAARSGIGKGITEQNTKREKLRHGMTALSALTDHALEGSIVTGNSMKARGYGCGKRTAFYSRSLRRGEWIYLLLIGVFVGLMLGFGGMGAEFDPVISAEPVGVGFLAYSILLIIPVALRIKEAIVWRILKYGI